MRRLWLPLILFAGTGLWLYTHPDTADELRTLLPGKVQPTSETLYKWRDAQGLWQVTDTLPPAGVTYETLELRADVNVLPVPPQLRDSR